MKIVIVGDGKVGFALAMQLDKEGHDVTIIEEKQKVLNNTLNLLDVVGIQGNGANYDIQMAAGVNQADLLIAATSADEMNLLCCMIAKKMGAQRTIARIRNPEYIQSLALLKEDLGLSMHINPEMAAAHEISRALRFPSDLRLRSFAKSRVELVDIKIKEGNPLIGKPMFTLYYKRKCLNVLFCVVQRDVFIPTGQTVILEGDRVSLTGSPKDIRKFLSSIGILIACITHKGMPKVANGDSVVNSGDTVIVISSIAGLGDINDVLA